jgi:hypothetical protein
MFSLFNAYRDAERAALAPLVDAALALDPADVPRFLDDMRRDAPTVTARLEDLLGRTPVPTPGPTRRASVAPRLPATASPVPLRPTGQRGKLSAADAAFRTEHTMAA